MAEGALDVTVIDPEKTVFQGAADMVVVPAWDGEVGVLRGHAPMMVLLGAGHIRVGRGKDVKRFAVSGGFLQVAHNVVTVLSESAGDDDLA